MTTVALSYGQNESNLEKVSNIKPFVNKYKWKGIDYPSKVDNKKTFEKNNQNRLIYQKKQRTTKTLWCEC